MNKKIPAMVAWFPKVSVFHSVNSALQRTVDPIPSKYGASIARRQKCPVANSKLQSAGSLWRFMMQDLMLYVNLP